MKNPKKQGFTLLEIMIVVAILSILAVATVPNIISYVQKFKEKKVLDDMRRFKIGASLFYEKEGRWPVAFSEFIDIKNPKGATNPWGFPYKMDKYFFYANRPGVDTDEIGFIPPVYYRDYYHTINSGANTFKVKPIYIEATPPLSPLSLGPIMAETMEDDRVNLYFVNIKGSSVMYFIIQYNSNTSGVITDFDMYLKFKDPTITYEGNYFLDFVSDRVFDMGSPQWRRYIFFKLDCLDELRFKFRLDDITTAGSVPYEFGYISAAYDNFFPLKKGVEYEVILRN